MPLPGQVTDGHSLSSDSGTGTQRYNHKEGLEIKQVQLQTMAPRSSFWETSTNGFCKQELRSPAQRGYDKALCQQGFCELPFTSSECSPKGKATFLLRVFKVGRLEEEGGACAILDTAWLMFSACLCPSLLKDFSLHSPLPGSLPWAPRSLTSPVWWPSLTHLSPLSPTPTPEPRAVPSLSWPPSYCIIFLPVMWSRNPWEPTIHWLLWTAEIPNILPLHPGRRGLYPNRPFEPTV